MGVVVGDTEPEEGEAGIVNVRLIRPDEDEAAAPLLPPSHILVLQLVDCPLLSCDDDHPDSTAEIPSGSPHTGDRGACPEREGEQATLTSFHFGLEGANFSPLRGARRVEKRGCDGKAGRGHHSGTLVRSTLGSVWLVPTASHSLALRPAQPCPSDLISHLDLIGGRAGRGRARHSTPLHSPIAGLGAIVGVVGRRWEGGGLVV